MTNDDQARADATADLEVDDPLDSSNVPDTGAAELAGYSDFVDSLEEGGEGDGFESPESEPESEGGEEPQGEEPGDFEAGSEQPEAGGEQEEEEPAGEEPTANRFRIRAKDEVEAEALSLRKRHPDWSLEDCLTKAKAILGVAERSEEQAGEESQPARTASAVSQEIEALRVKYKEATEGLEFDQAADIFMQIEKLRDERDDLRISERYEQDRREQVQQESLERQFAESERKAVTYYPDTTDPESAMTKRIIELDKQMRDLGDPLYSSPDKPFLLAKMAARELGIPMTNPSSAQAAKRTAPRTGSPVNPASGNARTTPKTSASPRADEALAGVNSLEAYEDLVEAM